MIVWQGFVKNKLLFVLFQGIVGDTWNPLEMKTISALEKSEKALTWAFLFIFRLPWVRHFVLEQINERIALISEMRTLLSCVMKRITWERLVNPSTQTIAAHFRFLFVLPWAAFCDVEIQIQSLFVRLKGKRFMAVRWKKGKGCFFGISVISTEPNGTWQRLKCDTFSDQHSDKFSKFLEIQTLSLAFL